MAFLVGRSRWSWIAAQRCFRDDATRPATGRAPRQSTGDMETRSLPVRGARVARGHIGKVVDRLAQTRSTPFGDDPDNAMSDSPYASMARSQRRDAPGAKSIANCSPGARLDRGRARSRVAFYDTAPGTSRRGASPRVRRGARPEQAVRRSGRSRNAASAPRRLRRRTCVRETGHPPRQACIDASASIA